MSKLVVEYAPADVAETRHYKIAMKVPPKWLEPARKTKVAEHVNKPKTKLYTYGVIADRGTPYQAGPWDVTLLGPNPPVCHKGTIFEGSLKRGRLEHRSLRSAR
ncbi:hypothetical protein JL721_2952 [Aureococcus anophagefferens]|nr:hypothetical protein JL721_2952 [Aureococcus anophagefferens]